jgi:hypothetical protein
MWHHKSEIYFTIVKQRFTFAYGARVSIGSVFEHSAHELSRTNVMGYCVMFNFFYFGAIIRSQMHAQYVIYEQYLPEA